MTVETAALGRVPARRIVAAIADACERWTDADFPPRVRATRAIMERLEYSEPVVDFALDRLFKPVTAAAVGAAIEGELGSIEALDGFVQRALRPQGFARAAGRVTIVSSDTTIGVALWPALFALCAKCDVTVKDRADDLIAAFSHTLAEEEPEFAASFRAERWNGHDAPAAAERLRDADVVVAFGRAESLGAIRARCGNHTSFLGFGHRTSVTYIEREALHTQRSALQAARAVARDALLYDGEGCLSAHASFVESGGTIGPIDFAILLQRACEEASVEFPPARADTREQRNLAAFRAAQEAPQPAPAQAFLLAFDPPRSQAPPLVPRSLGLYPVAAPQDAAAFLIGHGVPLEAFAVVDPAAAREDVTRAALAAGAARIARAGYLQSPEIESNHGGAARIAPFVRWVVRDR